MKPPFLSTSERGSYAQATILERKPRILQQVIDDNHYPDEIIGNLNSFRLEILNKPIQPLLEDAPDVEFWNNELEKFFGNSWLQVPWYFAETFFYRKLLEAVEYFQHGDLLRLNPFQRQKENQINLDVPRVVSEYEGMEKLPEDNQLEVLIHSALWGNRIDLSNYTVKEKVKVGAGTKDEKHNVIIDDTEKTKEFFGQHRTEVHFFNDNVGADVFNDLILARFLLESNRVDKIVFHLKSQPFFVSDAMPEDIASTIKVLGSIKTQFAKLLTNNLLAALNSNRLILRDDPFWSSCLMFTQMPDYLLSCIQHADLVIIKGDVNYRRLLEDRHWPHHTPIRNVTHYFPSSFLIMRTLKGEIIVGLESGAAEKISTADPSWLINGKRGIIQLVLKNK